MPTQNSNNHTAAFARRGIVIASLLAMPFLNGDESVELDPFIVGATRTERAADTLGVSADRLVGSEIEKGMVRDLRHALFNVNGVYAPSDEALASTSEIMIRGNSGSRVLSIVDGAKTNSSIFSAGRFMAGASGFNLDSVEVIRGAQSTLYGSSAIGGVILLETRRGRGTPSYAVTAEAGSFNSYLAALQGQGESGELDFSFHLASQESDNERLDNEGKMKSYSFRFDYDVSDNTTIGVVSRGEFTDYSNPVGDLTPPPSVRVQSDTAVMSAYVETINNEWTQKLTLSLLDEYYRQTGSLYIGDASNLSMDWQNAIDISESTRLVAGSTWELQEGNDNSFPESEGENWALFAQAEVAASESVNLVVGARYDDYEFAGSKSTLRANGSWMLPSKTKLRAAVGSAFRAPNFFRLFSTSGFALGNPNLKPEESESWEFGFDHYFNDGKAQFGLTYFRNDIENLVVWIPTTGWDGTYANRDIAENYGVEAYANFQVNDIWNASIAYTWTESESTNVEFDSTARVAGVPRHQVSITNDLWIDEKWSAGVGINYVLGRESFGSADIDDYVLARAYGRYRLSDDVSLTARIENALDEDYTVSYSRYSGRVPARGFGAFGGLEWRF
ncbi:MAG: TonB-dependent receptor [Opitutaceae bacterium]|nr:TonB-dependent receptor [Opitutaceae bacterium]